MSWFKNQLRAGFELIDEAAGETITLRLGDESIEIENVTRGESEFTDTSADGETVITVTSIDFLIRPDLIDFGDGPIEPMVGMQILTDDDEVYDLMPGNKGQPWRWTEGRKVRYRIHTLRRSK